MVSSPVREPGFRPVSLWLLGLDYCHTHAGVTLLLYYKVKGLCFGRGVVLVPLRTVLVLDHEGLALDLFHRFSPESLGNPAGFPAGVFTATLQDYFRSLAWFVATY